jgi:uncharacterized protein YcfJ
MSSGDSPKRTTVGIRVCYALGACFGGGIGTLLGVGWAPPAAAAIGASLGGKAGGTVR